MIYSLYSNCKLELKIHLSNFFKKYIEIKKRSIIPPFLFFPLYITYKKSTPVRNTTTNQTIERTNDILIFVGNDLLYCKYLFSFGKRNKLQTKVRCSNGLSELP